MWGETMAKQMMLTLTFKDSEKWIYEEICKHSAKGGWVKDILADYIRNQENPSQPKKESQKQEIDVANFLNF